MSGFAHLVLFNPVNKHVPLIRSKPESHLLSQSVELHPDQSFHLNHCCISDTNGITKFQLEANQSGQSHVCPNQGKGIEVPNLVLDDYCDENQIDRVNFACIIQQNGKKHYSLKNIWKCMNTVFPKYMPGIF